MSRTFLKLWKALFAFPLAVMLFAFTAGMSANAVASTDLNPAHVGADSATFSEDCDGINTDSFSGVLWHFILEGTTAVNSGELTVQFASFGVVGPKVYDKKSGPVLHWNIFTPTDDTLLGASTTADGNNLNLSHVCHGTGAEGDIPTSSITTEIHLGATDADPDNPIVVDACNVLSGSTVHDSAQCVTTPTTAAPAGSTITFFFYQNDTCAAPPVGTPAVFYVDGLTDPTIDPALAKGPLAPGSYSYQAFFASGDPTKLIGSESACEPFHVYNAALTPGYWKNHLAPLSSSCTSKQGCSANGPWTQDGLPQSLGNFYTVSVTGDATAVFNKMNCGSSTDQDAIGCLAGHLLATKLNLWNQSDPCINSVVTDADAFLTAHNYVGPNGTYGPLSAADRASAISLKTALDQYNNGLGCTNFCQ
jgi:hypothetical protein